jgi:hypothetical protein
MNKHRSILAALLAIALGVVLGGGGCASGGQTSASSGDDGGGSDVTLTPDVGATEAGACASGKVKCGTTCTSTTTDPKNCGKCGAVCATGQVCSQGACAAGCSGGETLCGGPAEAGAAEAGAAADSSAPAEGGSGDDGGGAEDDGGVSPVADSGSGGGGDAGAPYCANLNNDPSNCGGCGVSCGASGTCVNGNCQLGACPGGQVGCAASGTCIPTGTCCNSGECTITGEVCPMPGGQCTCPTGEKACMGTLMACISSSACCTAADCNMNGATGQTCPTPGQACACPATLQCCQASDCTPEQNVATTSCSPSTATTNPNTCSVATCNAGCYDLDSNYSDGCECCDTATAGHTCPNAAAATNVAIGQSVNFSGTIPEPTGGDWYSVSFAPSPTNSTTFHPKITFSANPSIEFVFEVLAGSCSGAPITCGTEGGAATSVTTWETSYAGPSPAGDPTSVTPGGVSNFVPIPSVGTVFIHVFRASTTSPATCDQYTLTVSE